MESRVRNRKRDDDVIAPAPSRQRQCHRTVTKWIITYYSQCFLCPQVHLGPHLELSSSVLIHSINPSKSCQKSLFSSMLLQTCGGYALTMFSIDPLPPVSWLLVSLKPSPSTLSPSHFFFYQFHCRIVCSHIQCFLIYYFSTSFPVSTVHLFSFGPLCQSALFSFHSLVLHFTVPRLTTVRLFSPSTVPVSRTS